ncbi:oxidoreductase, C-terminal [Nonlabens marinus S1-08]|uniref:Oxidoreductase, C-terminal n=2 Tax=Nonlabens TaxID=363408 RepID=W8VTU9_9FLAO|nr:oxidoreductase, C-terminal [Nonlabens marinus S1-08]
MGLGKIAHKFAQDLVQVPGANLHAVGSRSEGKAKAFANEYQVTKTYASYEELAKDPELDIIYIATPHSLHFENTMMCLNAGKSVLCEKPIALNAQQAEQMIALAKKKNLFLMEGIWTRFIPATQKVLDLLSEGLIGEIQYIKSDFGFRMSAPPESRLRDPKLGGGALLDIGIYPLYLSLLLLGEPQRLKAEAILDDRGIDTYCAIIGQFAGKAKSVMEASFLSHTQTEAFIYGIKGFIHMKSPFHNCSDIEVTTYETNTTEVYHLPITGNGYFHEIEHVQQCLQQGKTESDLMPQEMSASLMKHLDKIRASIGLEYNA